eukprot:GHVU01030799.1.p1 GENE.GHVU01030799.1~~GHVU01030799.1.p1  ORF type:complete len:213 (+),score=32.78 GHVU01030799.1:103-741(+)
MSTQKKRQQMCAEHLQKKTHFERFEVDALLKLFGQHAKKTPDGKQRMDRLTFCDNILYHGFSMTDDILMDRVFRIFDKDNDGYISPEEWVVGLSCYLRGTELERMHFAFAAYDLNGDGYISKEEMFQLLKNSLLKPNVADEDPDEGVKDMVDMVIKKMDQDRDGRVSFKDYETTIMGENLLLEALGSCLPCQETIDRFESQCLSGDDRHKKK